MFYYLNGIKDLSLWYLKYNNLLLGEYFNTDYIGFKVGQKRSS